MNGGAVKLSEVPVQARRRSDLGVSLRTLHGDTTFIQILVPERAWIAGIGSRKRELSSQHARILQR